MMKIPVMNPATPMVSTQLIRTIVFSSSSLIAFPPSCLHFYNFVDASTKNVEKSHKVHKPPIALSTKKSVG